MKSFSRLTAGALPAAALLALAGCGDIKGADDRQFYVKPPLDKPGLFVDAERPSEMTELGTPRRHVPQQEANFIAPAHPVRPAQQPPAQGGTAAGQPAPTPEGR